MIEGLLTVVGIIIFLVVVWNLIPYGTSHPNYPMNRRSYRKGLTTRISEQPEQEKVTPGDIQDIGREVMISQRITNEQMKKLLSYYGKDLSKWKL